MRYRKNKYRRTEIEDEKLENAMDRSIRDIAFNPDVAVKRRRCY